MKRRNPKANLFIVTTVFLLFFGTIVADVIAAEVDAGDPQVVAMHDMTDPNGPVDPNLLDPSHPAWPMAFSTNPNSPLSPQPVTVVLNGSYTADPGASVSIAWSVTDAAQASHVTIDDARILTPHVTFDEPNLYSLSLTVDDGTGPITDTVLIKIKLASHALQAHWKFDGDPNDPNDFDWHYTGWTGSPDFGAGLIGDAIILKQEDSVTYGYGIGGETSISVAFWMKPDSDFSSDGTGLIRKFSGTSSDPQGGWSFQLRNETEMRWRNSSGWDGGRGDLKVTASFPVDTWTHIVGTHDGATGEMKFYLNGQEVAQRTTTETCFDSFIDEMTIGSNNWSGMIDDLYIFDYPLDPNEIRSLVLKGMNVAPEVQLASEQVKILQPTNEVLLTGTVVDNGPTTAVWTVVEEPENTTVIFDPPDSLTTTAQFTAIGNYRLRVTVTDQGTPPMSSSDEIVVKVRPADFDGLEAYISFDDQTANSRLSTSVPYIGELFGDPVWTPGIDGQEDTAILLDGIDDHINYDAFIGSDPCCTIALWVGNDAVDKDTHIIQKWPSDSSRKGWMLRNRISSAPGQIAAMIGSGFSGAGAYEQTDAYIPAVAWTHIALTYDGTLFNIYMNGELVHSVDIGEDGYSPADLVTPMVIGYRWNNDTRFFTGAIDEVRIYDYALSVDELRPLVAIGMNMPPTVRLDTDQIKILQPENQVSLTGTVIEEEPYTTAWEVLEKPAGAMVTFGDPAVLATTVQLDTVGNYRLRVTVTEQGDEALTDSDEIVIKVRPADYDGLEAYISFDNQNANSNFATSVPYVGQLFGNPQWTEGIGGDANSAILLDGVDDHINFDAYIGSDPCCTISLWILDDAVDVQSHIIQKWASDTGGQGWLLRHRPTDNPGEISPLIGSGFGNGNNFNNSGGYLPAGVWTHLAMTFDGSLCNLYMNGVLFFSEPIDSGYSTGDLVTPMVIGYRWNNDTRFFKGAIDEVRIYDYALSAEALEALYQADVGE